MQFQSMKLSELTLIILMMSNLTYSDIESTLILHVRE